MRFTGKIREGKLSLHNPSSLKEYLEIEGEGEVYIDIKPAKVRNIAQNNYYWIMLKDFGNQCGYSPEEMHDVCKTHFKISSEE